MVQGRQRRKTSAPAFDGGHGIDNTMYRVRFVLQRPGYRKRYIEGIYRPRGDLTVDAMKRACREDLRRHLEAKNPEYGQFDIELTCFSRLRIDFLLNVEFFPNK